ncbi:GLPGLI family protein [Mucilaginibacter sp. PPCGB 2223]|uniref:GLPGLI family protein n=1 Tax=Mucilaginibacter sp. PPCGB 2223 TaxID=1886027 RepID=UPI0015869718|nr:GLPGLI family protein [Mucilaginibacter sp. PPCGB 2223]
MKTKLLFPIFLMLVTLSAMAQKPDSAKIMVHYKFTHVRDTTKRDTPYTENMILMVGQTASVYKSYDSRLQMERMKKQMDEIRKSGTMGPMNFRSGGANITPTEIFQFAATNKMVRKEKLLNSYLIEDPYPAINWKISGDTTTISNLHCQKATGHFKGRDYVAWFCPDLPFRTGPWKLCGLPGLIVEAHDVKNDVIFKFDGIEEIVKTAPDPDAIQNGVTQQGGRVMLVLGADDNQDPNLIALPANGIKTTQKEFDNLREAMRKDPQAFIQSAMAGMGGGVRFNRADGSGPQINMKMSNTPGPVINNPIELPEKK